MELREQLELIEVEYQNEGNKALLTFLDEDNGEVLEVSFNKQNYDNDSNKWVDDEEKAEKVEKWCNEYFGETFSDLNNAIGAKKDVYHYDNFNSLWEANYPVKFTEERVGEILNCTITEVRDNGNMILIEYADDDTKDLHQSKMNYSKYLEARKEWLVEPTKKTKQYEKFEKKFGVPVEDASSLVGKKIMVEIRSAFGFPYGDIKKPSWAKK